jgi:exodeoxyribonuclease-3
MDLAGESLHEARYIEAVTNNVRVASVYVPNGQTTASDKFTWKLAFLDRLYQHLKQRSTWGEAFVIGGDYNIAPTDRDVYDPKGWHEEVLCTTVEREAFRRLLNLGYYNALPTHVPNPEHPLYSWWDYRQGSFQKNHGLLIDHLLLSPQALDLLIDAGVETGARGHDKPSDHAPVWVILRK